jgi:hypothetical protein
VAGPRRRGAGGGGRWRGDPRRGDALNAGELALTGAALIAALGLTPGPAVGRALAACLEAVLDEPTRNQPEALVAIARAHLDGGATPA